MYILHIHSSDDDSRSKIPIGVLSGFGTETGIILDVKDNTLRFCVQDYQCTTNTEVHASQKTNLFAKWAFIK